MKPRVWAVRYATAGDPDARIKILSYERAPINAGDVYGWDAGVALEVRCVESLAFYEETE